MAYNIKIKPIVYFDVEEAFIWHNKQVTGLGGKFYDHFWSAIEIIQLTPFVYSYLRKPVRRYKMRKFPFNVHYVIEGNEITILGVVHVKRSNAFVKKRLR